MTACSTVDHIIVSLVAKSHHRIVNRSEIANVSIIARIAARDQGRALTCTGVPPAPTLGLEPRESGLLERVSERGWIFLGGETEEGNGGEEEGEKGRERRRERWKGGEGKT